MFNTNTGRSDDHPAPSAVLMSVSSAGRSNRYIRPVWCLSHNVSNNLIPSVFRNVGGMLWYYRHNYSRIKCLSREVSCYSTVMNSASLPDAGCLRTWLVLIHRGKPTTIIQHAFHASTNTTNAVQSALPEIKLPPTNLSESNPSVGLNLQATLCSFVWLAGQPAAEPMTRAY
jgi:hypothetical protein